MKKLVEFIILIFYSIAGYWLIELIIPYTFLCADGVFGSMNSDCFWREGPRSTLWLNDKRIFYFGPAAITFIFLSSLSVFIFNNSKHKVIEFGSVFYLGLLISVIPNGYLDRSIFDEEIFQIIWPVIVIVISYYWMFYWRKKTKTKTKNETIGISSSLVEKVYVMGKRNVLAFIVLVFLLKPVIHFTLFPEQEEYVNYDRKIILTPKDEEMTYVEMERFYSWSGNLYMGSKGEKLEREAVSGTNRYNYFYYPKENRFLSFRSHLQLLLKEKLWIFSISFGSMLLLVFLFNDKIKAR